MVTQLTRLIDVPRRCLHIDATAKGLVAGPLTFVDADEKFVDCNTPTGTFRGSHGFSVVLELVSFANVSTI